MRDGVVSREAARDTYRVVIASDVRGIDRGATDHLRGRVAAAAR